MILKRTVLIVICLGFVLGSMGCGKRPDTKKPIEAVKQEAASMSVRDLEGMVKTYQNEILKKQKDLDRVKEEAKALSVSEVFGPKGEQIKTRLNQIRGEIQELEKRLSIYTDRLKAPQP